MRICFFIWCVCVCVCVLSWSAVGGGEEGGALLIHLCGSATPSFMQQTEPFL